MADGTNLDLVLASVCEGVPAPTTVAIDTIPTTAPIGPPPTVLIDTLPPDTFAPGTP